jgi:carboxypeptidase PM20D1
VVIVVYGVLFLSALLIGRTLFFRSKRRVPTVISPPFELEQSDILRAADSLATAVTFKTIAPEQWDDNSSLPFIEFHQFLKERYPLLFSHLTVIETQYHNLVLCFEGTDPTLEPALLTAHIDVVPASPDEQAWIHPPFEKNIVDGYVWGRGSFDDKSSLIAMCESIELMLHKHILPQRTFYIAFGCDEEIRGDHGAATIAKMFEKMGLRFSFVLDEGGVVTKNFLSGLKHNVAVVGVSEKGNVDISLRCTQDGGHSSSPNQPTALGILAKAVSNIEHAKMPVCYTKPVIQLLHTMGMNASFGLSVVLLNQWLFRPLISSLFSKSNTLNALIRNTCTVTVVHSSDASNVISHNATAIANVRLLPGSKIEDVLRWMKKVIGDNRVELEIVKNSKLSRPSPVDNSEFLLLEQVITSTCKETIVSPFLMTGGTDALNYEHLSDHVYRFTPVIMDQQELSRMHGIDERLSLENLFCAIRFYTLILTS